MQSISARQTTRAGFTLVELTVVIFVIVLLATMAIPTAISLLRSGSDSQAYNIVTATLSAARAEAIQRNTYVAVHFQMAVKQEKSGGQYKWQDGANNYFRRSEGLTYAAIFIYDYETATDTQKKWLLAPNHSPKALPGSITVAPAGSTTVTDTTCLTVVFSPNGSIARQINGQNIDLTASPAFTDGNPTASANTQAFWLASIATPRPGVAALTIVDYDRYSAETSAPKKTAYLTDNAQLIPINIYTGQLMVQRR